MSPRCIRLHMEEEEEQLRACFHSCFTCSYHSKTKCQTFVHLPHLARAGRAAFGCQLWHVAFEQHNRKGRETGAIQCLSCVGLTDWDITSAWSTLAVFIVGAWAGSAQQTGAVVAALVMSGIAGAAVNASASIMGDFKTGYYTLAHPRALLCTQVGFRQPLPHSDP